MNKFDLDHCLLTVHVRTYGSSMSDFMVHALNGKISNDEMFLFYISNILREAGKNMQKYTH